MTAEEIKNLKQGDKVLISATFECHGTENDVACSFKFHHRGKERDGIMYVSADCVSLPPKQESRFFLDADDNMFFLILYGRPRNYEFVARLDKRYYSKAMAEDECKRLNETEYSMKG
jgi:hypothetical protein